MIIKSLELSDYRNYESLLINFDKGTNILYGDNAQGKTNILEAIGMCATARSHRRNKDSELIKFGCEEAHIKTILNKDNEDISIDMHLRKGKNKFIAINKEKVPKVSDLIGIMNIIFFSPEDLNIIKDGPVFRRNFVDMQLCQLDNFYIYNFNNYNKIIEQRNSLLRDLYFNPTLKDTLDIWDNQIESYGSKIIERRETFIEQLNEIIEGIHFNLSGSKEKIKIIYKPNVGKDDIGIMLKANQQSDIKNKITSVGPHRDDLIFTINDMDVRKFGSQGQQRCAALSLKLAQIEIVKKIINDNPILLLDDVLSELDSNRQNFLLNTIGDIQTIITCTGLDEFVNSRIEIDRIYRITAGNVEETK